MHIRDLCTPDAATSSLRTNACLKDRRAVRPRPSRKRMGEAAPGFGWAVPYQITGQNNHQLGFRMLPAVQDSRHGVEARLPPPIYHGPAPAGHQPQVLADWDRQQSPLQQPIVPEVRGWPAMPQQQQQQQQQQQLSPGHALPQPVASQKACCLPFPRMPLTPPATSLHPVTLEPSAAPAPPTASALSASRPLGHFPDLSPLMAHPLTPPEHHVASPDRTEASSRPDSAESMTEQRPQETRVETQPSHKRPAVDDDGPGPAPSEDSSGKKAKLCAETGKFAPEFACPFYKRNRRKYWHQRSCRTSGWPSVHRVKEHLYRHHMHFVCDRCSETFKDPEKLRKHLRQKTPCGVSPRIVDEDMGFDQEVEKKLRSRKKIEGQDEGDKWARMFRLLFPSYDGKVTPSPYVDYDPRDEVPPWTLPPLQAREESPPSPVRDSGQGSRVAIERPAGLMAMVAAAAEQTILAVEARTSEEPDMTSAEKPKTETKALLETSIRRMVEQEVRAALSNMPSPTTPAGAAEEAEEPCGEAGEASPKAR